MPPLPLLLPPPPPSSTAVPRSLQPRVANLVLLPSSGLSAESTEPVNYSLMHRVPILLFSDPESLSLSSKGYSFPIISSPNSLRPGDLKVDALLRVRFANVFSYRDDAIKRRKKRGKEKDQKYRQKDDVAPEKGRLFRSSVIGSSTLHRRGR